MGFSDLPQAGDSFCAFPNEKSAQNLLALRKSDKPVLENQKENLNPEELLAQMETVFK